MDTQKGARTNAPQRTVREKVSGQINDEWAGQCDGIRRTSGHLGREKSPTTDSSTVRKASSLRIEGTSVNRKVCSCEKDSRGHPRQPPEAIKVLFLVHTELQPAHLPLLPADWRVAPCILTAGLCVSWKTINLLPHPQERAGRGNGGFPFFIVVVRFKHTYPSKAPSRPVTFHSVLLHAAVENELKQKIK